MKRMNTLLIFSILLFTFGCAQAEGQGNGQGNYEETKKMVVDILKTDEGKKAIQDILTEDSVKQKLVMEQDGVKEAIKTTLASEDAEKFWKKSFEDPKFAESFAKGIEKEHEKLIKNLMKDPEYQGMMIEILQNPEMEDQMKKVLKTKEYREELKSLITETFESPLFKAKLQDILLKGAEEMQKKGGKEGEKSESGDGGGSEEGDGES